MAKVKVLSLMQPWAHLVVIGAKKIETRSWDTKYRGPLLIHASKRFTEEQAKLCQQSPFNRYIDNLHDIETGYIIGAVDLWQIESTEAWLRSADLKHEDAQEYCFGDYGKNRFAWHLRYAMEFNEMIPARGSLGLWDFEIDHPLIKTL